jgi:hypothetical protein
LTDWTDLANLANLIDLTDLTVCIDCSAFTRNMARLTTFVAYFTN